MSPVTVTSMSFSVMPGSSAVILNAFSSSETSTAGRVMPGSVSSRQSGSTSNSLRIEGNPKKPPENRSNRRSISVRNACQGSGPTVRGVDACFTGTGVVAMVVLLPVLKGAKPTHDGKPPAAGNMHPRTRRLLDLTQFGVAAGSAVISAAHPAIDPGQGAKTHGTLSSGGRWLMRHT